MNPYTTEKVAKHPHHGSPPGNVTDLPGGLVLFGLWRVVKRRRTRRLQRRHDEYVARMGKG